MIPVAKLRMIKLAQFSIVSRALETEMGEGTFQVLGLVGL